MATKRTRATAPTAPSRPAKRGRPSKFTPETVEKVVKAIGMGATYPLAAGYARISYSLLREWIVAGEAGDPAFVEFVEALKEAEGTASMRWLARIEKAAETQWQAAAWKLERRYPKDYGRQTVEVSGPDGGAVPVAVTVTRRIVRPKAGP